MRKVDGKIPWILTPHLHPPFVFFPILHIFRKSSREKLGEKSWGPRVPKHHSLVTQNSGSSIQSYKKLPEKPPRSHPKIGSNHSVQSSQADGAFTSSSSVHPQNQILFLKNIHIKCTMWPDHVSDLIRTHSRISSWVCKTFWNSFYVFSSSNGFWYNDCTCIIIWLHSTDFPNPQHKLQKEKKNKTQTKWNNSPPQKLSIFFPKKAKTA